MYHDIPKTLRHIEANLVRCWQNVRFAQQQSRRLVPSHQRANEVDTGHPIEVV
jgi:hypothetical protein